MKIALDVMGGDHAPAVTVEGAIWAARDWGLTIQLVGQPSVIEPELAKHETSGLDLPIIPASEIIGMEEKAATAVRSKPDSSMVVAVKHVKAGESDAFVSAGNSGAAMTAGLLGLGRIKGIKRPALTTVFPTHLADKQVVLLDVGANTEVQPEYLYQFALMGHHYARTVMHIDNPTVGLLSIGEEEDKGSKLVQEATVLLRESSLNFIGNVEGKDVPEGVADVVVTDGFTGNVLIKSAEGVARAISNIIRQEVNSLPRKIGALLMKGAFDALKTRMDWREFGGSPLLGVNGLVIVAHGRSDAYAVRNAIRVAKQAVENDLVRTIKQALEA